jgi:3-oxoadipate enol-lactonase
MSTMEKVSVNGAELAVRIEGKPGNPWLVLSNNLGATHECWRRQIPILTGNYRVLRYDARGHGDSSAPAGPYSLEMFGADVIGLMDHFKIAKADIMGVSLGAITAMGLAINHPDRVSRVVCCDARSDATQPFIDNWTARIANVRESGMKGLIGFLMGMWFTPAFNQSHPEVIKEATDMVLRTNAASWIEFAEAMKKLDYKRHLGKIRAPALFVVGAQDPASSPAVMREMASLTPGADFIEIDPGSHICMVENPDAFNRAVGNWLNTRKAA